MKYIKLFAVALGALIVSACSDSKDYNTASDVTVEMEKSEITIKEHLGRFLVPVKITGNPNGPVKVKVKVEPSGNNPAKPFEESNGTWSGNYIVTSNEINISADEKVGNIEIYTIDDKIENDDRSFIVTIESAEGASVGMAKTTLVLLADNDKFPYEKMQGNWSLSYLNPDGVEESVSVTLAGYDEDSKKYGVEFMLNGLFAQYASADGTNTQVYFFDDESIDMRYVEIILPQTIGVFGLSGYPEGFLIWLITAQRNAQGDFGLDINNLVLTGIISDDFETITFDESIGFYGYIADSGFGDQLGGVGGGTDLVMKRQ